MSEPVTDDKKSIIPIIIIILVAVIAIQAWFLYEIKHQIAETTSGAEEAATAVSRDTFAMNSPPTHTNQQASIAEPPVSVTSDPAPSPQAQTQIQTEGRPEPQSEPQPVPQPDPVPALVADTAQTQAEPEPATPQSTESQAAEPQTIEPQASRPQSSGPVAPPQYRRYPAPGPLVPQAGNMPPPGPWSGTQPGPQPIPQYGPQYGPQSMQRPGLQQSPQPGPQPIPGTEPRSPFDDPFFQRGFDNNAFERDMQRDIERMRREMDAFMRDTMQRQGIYGKSYNDPFRNDPFFNQPSFGPRQHTYNRYPPGYSPGYRPGYPPGMKHHKGFSNLLESNVSISDFNIEDKGDQYLVKVRIPGADKQNIKVDINDRRLTVAGVQHQTSKRTDRSGNTVSESSSSTSFKRGTTLPGPVDPSTMRTKFDHDTLEILVAKAG